MASHSIAWANSTADYRNPEIGIDLGTVISARQTLTYDTERWLGQDPNVQPTAEAQSVVVEYAAHPKAKLYVATGPESVLASDLPSPPLADRTATSTWRRSQPPTGR